MFKYSNTSVCGPVALVVMLSLFMSSSAHGQYVALTRTSVKQLEKDGEVIDQLGNPLKLGVSLGYNAGLQKLYTTAISPTDYKLYFEEIYPLTVVLSTAVMFNWKNYYLRKKKDPAGDTNLSNTEGPVFLIPSRWSVGAVVNLAQFSAQSNLYNQQIDGGLGIGYELNENIFILGTFEFLSVKQPREYFVNQYKDKNSQVIIDGAPLKSLNYDDTSIFTNKYIPSISVKVVFGLALTKPSSSNDKSANKKSAVDKSDKETLLNER